MVLLVLYVPLTNQHRLSPYEMLLPRLSFLDQEAVANVQGLRSIPTARLDGSVRISATQRNLDVGKPSIRKSVSQASRTVSVLALRRVSVVESVWLEGIEERH